MRFQFIVLVTILAVVDLSVAANQVASPLLDQNNAQSSRQLRFTGVVDDNEERGAWYQGITKLFKPSTASNTVTKVQIDNPESAKLAGKSLSGAYKSLKLNKIKSVDDLFSSRGFNTFNWYITHWNSQSRNELSSVVKFFSKELGDKKTAKLFARAAQSSDENVSAMGKAYQNQLLNQWAKNGKTAKQVKKIAPSLEGEFATLLVKMAVKAEKKATR